MIDRTPDPDNKLVAYLGADSPSLRELARRLSQHGLCLRSFENPHDLSVVGRENPPAVLILEVKLVRAGTSLTDYLSGLLGGPTAHLICIDEHDGIEKGLLDFQWKHIFLETGI